MGLSDALLLAVHLTFTSVAIVAVDDIVQQNTRYGTIRGLRKTYNYGLYGHLTDTVDEFLGIPYAAPPTGARRWKPPEPPKSWSGIRDATRYSWVCPQVGVFHNDTQEHFQSEDCLFLNIYSPYQPERPNAKYPVMIYIHGGSYEVGAGRIYSGRVMAQYGVVVITINYRLGALGFLTTGDSTLVGNYGIMDQVQALKWVHDNVAGFRGDPKRITLFGHSAGGSSVGLLLVMPAARGLFSGAIAQSGSVTASFSIHDQFDFSEYLTQVGQIFDCPTHTGPAIIDCMRDLPYKQIIDARPNFPRFDPIDPEFRPIVDGAWIPDKPLDLFLRGEFHRVPIMTGTVKEEFDNYFNGGPRYQPAFDVALDRYVGRLMKDNPTLNDVIRFQYTDWRHVENLEGSGDIHYDRGAVLSDMHMVAPTVQLARAATKFNPDVYLYHHVAPFSYHSIELNYVFGAPFSGDCADDMGTSVCFNATEKDRRHSQRLMRLWTNFAKYGDPTPQYHDLDMTGNWERYESPTSNYLHLNPHDTHMKLHLRPEQVAFWNTLVPRLMARLAWDEPPDNKYKTQMWVFIGLTLTLTVTCTFLLILLFKSKGQQR